MVQAVRSAEETAAGPEEGRRPSFPKSFSESTHPRVKKAASKPSRQILDKKTTETAHQTVNKEASKASSDPSDCFIEQQRPDHSASPCRKVLVQLISYFFVTLLFSLKLHGVALVFYLRRVGLDAN